MNLNYLVKFIDDMIMDCSVGNDSELNYCFINDEYGDESLIGEWSREWYNGYWDLWVVLEKVGKIEYNNIILEIEDEDIKLIFKD